MFKDINLSLLDMLGEDFIKSVCEANSFLGFMSYDEAYSIANQKVSFFSQETQNFNDELLSKVGTQVINPCACNNKGCPTDSFAKATHIEASPVTGFGCYRIGQDGKLYLTGKSEHYHSSLGHRFAGYKLIDNARKLGILNPTHNNTRGYVTRLLEETIIKEINIPKLDRIINLETGSLAVEAGVKMMLTRFYKLDKSFAAPKYSGKVPVFFVMADKTGASEANYHGTTVITQTFRNMWPEFYAKAEASDLYKVVPVMINDIDDFKVKIEKYNQGKYKTAGFLHEIILMNYGGIKLHYDFLQAAHKLCKETDTPVLVDEIQSCMWYKGMFLFKKYDLEPDFVVIGKGFSGGEYPASKIITTKEMDVLNQFGALVTNGQEELASLSYLITMKFMEVNGDEVERVSEYFDKRLKEYADSHPDKVLYAEGLGLLAALHFSTLDAAKDFANHLNEKCIDSSAQIYKVNCPPAVLLKPPVISSCKVIDYIINQIESV